MFYGIAVYFVCDDNRKGCSNYTKVSFKVSINEKKRTITVTFMAKSYNKNKKEEIQKFLDSEAFSKYRNLFIGSNFFEENQFNDFVSLLFYY